MSLMSPHQKGVMAVLHTPSRRLRAALCAVLVVLVAAIVAAPASATTRHGGSKHHGGSGLSISSASFGNLPNGGAAVTKYTLTNARGMSVSILDYGDTNAAYVKSNPYFGAIIGRYGNRIGPVGGQAGAPPGFVLDGNTYTLDANNGVASLHGGFTGFDKLMWSGTEIPPSNGTVGLKLTLHSPEGPGQPGSGCDPSKNACTGYPGTVDASVTFTLNNFNQLRFDYAATTDKPTVLNLTNH